MVAFDAATESTVQTGTSITQSHTCNGTYLIVAVHQVVNGQTAPSSVTYNGVAMTSLGRQMSSSQEESMDLYGLANPATGANNVVCTFGSSKTFKLGIMSFTGAGSASGFVSDNHALDGTGTTVTLASTANSMIADAFTVPDGVQQGTAGGGMTIRYQANNSGKGATASGTSSVTMTWTGASGFRCAHAAISIDPPTSPAPSLSYSVPSVDFKIRPQVIGY